METNKPPKTIKWYKNGKEIVPGSANEKFIPSQTSDIKFQLQISNTDLDDIADYQVCHNSFIYNYKKFY